MRVLQVSNKREAKRRARDAVLGGGGAKKRRQDPLQVLGCVPVPVPVPVAVYISPFLFAWAFKRCNMNR